MEFELRTQEGRYDLFASVKQIGSDLLVAIWGGDKPHIGAIAAAKAPTGETGPSAASVFCYSGHREDAIAKSVSEALASALSRNVVVTAGMHWDGLSKEGIEKVEKNSKILLGLILQKIGT